MSPETAALSAIAGSMVNPLDYPENYFPFVSVPDHFLIDDSMVLPPADAPVTIVRGPNIGEPPFTSPLLDELQCVIGLKVGDKITTDHIMPAGPRLKYRSNIPAYAQFVFENVDPEFSKRALSDKAKGLFTAIVGGMSYGQGSSREHAAICPMYLGVRLVIAKAFERIHSDNLINFGIIPLVFQDTGDYDRIQQGGTVVIRNLKSLVMEAELIPVTIAGSEYTFKLTVSQRQRAILLEGGLLNYTKKKFGA